MKGLTLQVVESNIGRTVTRTKELRPGADGTTETLREMATLIRSAARDEEFRAYAVSLISELQPDDFDGKNLRFFDFSKRIRYVPDPIGIERIADAWTTIRCQFGDCGDKTILLASLQAAVGMIPALAVQNFYGDADSEGYDHVLDAVQTPAGDWRAYDPTVEKAAPGWQADAKQNAYFEIYDDRGAGLAGFVSNVLPGLIQTGSQIGYSELQQARLSKKQEDALVAQWNDAIDQSINEFHAIMSHRPPTADDVAIGQQIYAALDSFATRSGSKRILDQWHDPNYQQGFQSLLNELEANSVAAPTVQVQGQAGGGGVVSSLVSTVTGGSSNWLQIAGLAVAAVVAAKVLKGVING